MDNEVLLNRMLTGDANGQWVDEALALCNELDESALLRVRRQARDHKKALDPDELLHVPLAWEDGLRQARQMG